MSMTTSKGSVKFEKVDRTNEPRQTRLGTASNKKWSESIFVNLITAFYDKVKSGYENVLL